MEQNGMKMDPETIQRLTGTVIGALEDVLGNVRMEVESEDPDDTGRFVDASVVEDGLIQLTIGDPWSCQAILLTPEDAIAIIEEIEGALDALPGDVDEVCECEDGDGPDTIIVATVKCKD